MRISKLPAKAPVATPKKKPQVLDADFDKTVVYLKTHTMEELKAVADVSEEMEKRLMEKCEDLTQNHNG